MSPLQLRRNRGQQILEYAVLLAVVSAAVVTMLVYAQRAVQANIRAIGEEVSGDAQAISDQEQTSVELDPIPGPTPSN